jgi:hypothetical protein
VLFARRLGYAVRLGLVHARAGGPAAAIVVIGVTAATGLVLIVLAGSLAAQDRSLGRAVERLPGQVRTVRAAWFGLETRSEPYASIDKSARAALAQVVDRPPTATVLFRESSIGGAFVALGAVDGLAPWVRLSSGRLPRACRPARCEVVQLRGDGRLPAAPGLRLVRVGRGTLRSPALFGDAVPAERNELERAQLAPRLQRRIVRYHQPAPPPLLLADGVAALAGSRELRATYRSYGWVVPLRARDARPWTVGRVVRAAMGARAQLQARSVGFEVTAPVEELRDAHDRARVGGRRLLLVGGQGATLLLAFAVFASTRLRRAEGDARRRLVLAGLPRWQVETATASHALVLSLAGTLLAAAIAAGVALVGGQLVRHALLAPQGLAAVSVLAAAAALPLALVLSAPSIRFGGRSLGPVDAAALTAALIIATALARGAADAEEVLRRDDTGIMLLLLPLLAAGVAAVVTARVLQPVLVLLERVTPRRALAARLAVLTAARRPGAALIAVGFLVVSVALAVFAEAYRSTLALGQRDTAAFALGADAVIREDLARLIPVRRVATPDRLASLGSGTFAAPVLRASGNVPGLAGATGIAVLGLERPLVQRLRGWRDDFAHEPLAQLTEPLFSRAAPLRGPRVRAGALAAPARSTIAGVAVEAIVENGDGEFVTYRLPAVVREPGTLLGLRIIPPPRLQERGADAGRPALGTLALSPLRSRGRVVTGYEGWIGTGGVRPRRRVLQLSLTNIEDAYFRPRQEIDRSPASALVSPRLAELAGERGRLPLQVAGQPLVVRVTGVASRFPSTRGDFAVLERSQLEAALNVAQPGAGFPTEAWVDADSEPARHALAQRLRRSPYDVFAVDFRAEEQSALASEPLARTSLLMLAVAASSALVLALLGLALATLADLRDDREELFDLEAQGAAPALLCRVVRLRAFAIAGTGVLAGFVAGFALALLAVDVVAVAAGAETPDPPLRLTLDLRPIAAGFALLAAVGAAIVLAPTSRAFRLRKDARP